MQDRGAITIGNLSKSVTSVEAHIPIKIIVRTTLKIEHPVMHVLSNNGTHYCAVRVSC